ncbi:MAG: enoyl-CoA hydratase/isomerase family protein [Desulfobacteraceae bacterium]|nr:enoyl-CoA hydratase/isomerase family protein [Desulfobacteraceae bacterium]
MTVHYETEGRIVTMTLDLTVTLNRLDAQTFRDLGSSLIKFRDDPDVWVAIITGTGEVFSLGADHETLLIPWAENTFQEPPMITRGLDVWKPLIAAINGPARGGGVEIPLACDIRIASENAYLQFPEVGRGLIPGLGGTQRLPRMVSSAKASEMILMGIPVSAEEAYRIGLVNKVVPLPRLLPTAMEWAEKIAENGPLALRRAKEAMIRGRNMSLEDGLRLELGFFEEVLRSEDYREGIRALKGNRKPEYRGR